MLKKNIVLVLVILMILFSVSVHDCLALSCSDGQFNCDGQNLQQWCQDPNDASLIKNWGWVTIKVCDGDKVCDISRGGCRDERKTDCETPSGSIVKNGSKTCGTDSGIIYVCDSGTLTESIQCESGYVCNYTSDYPVCVSSERECTDGVYSCVGKSLYGWCKESPKLLSDYKWLQIDTCDIDEYCDDSVGTCKVSTNEDLSCINTDGKTVKSGETTCGKNKGYIYTCNNGVLDGGRSCTGSMICDSSSGTATCKVMNEVEEAADYTVTLDGGNYDIFGDCGENYIDTALGCIPYDTKEFTSWLLVLLFGISGGIAFLLMVYGFIMMAMSSGDEKKMQGAKETVTSAITGLLVVIFALFLYRLIAVNILQIPGIN